MGIFDTIKGKGTKKGATKAKAPTKKVASKKEAADEAPKTETATSFRKGGSLTSSIILEKPLFTEKTDGMQAAGKYTFIVSRDANKTEVARAVRDIYGVTPVAVNISVLKGKTVSFGRRIGRRKDRKKAVVTLKKGEKITVMQGA